MAAAQKELEARNKELVLKAYQTIFGDNDVDAVDQYYSEDFIAHNPDTAGDGIQAVKDAIGSVWSTGPKKQIDFRKTCAEGDLVWLHIKYPDPINEGKWLAIVDIFRVKDGKIAEHWDVIQPMDSNHINAHPFF